MRLKKFNEFNSESTAYVFILQTIEDLGMTYESDTKNEDGDNAIIAKKDDKTFYISATDDDAEWANYNVQCFVKGKEIDDFETTDLKYGLNDCLTRKIY